MTGAWSIHQVATTEPARRFVQVPSITGRKGYEISDLVGVFLLWVGFDVRL